MSGHQKQVFDIGKSYKIFDSFIKELHYPSMGTAPIALIEIEFLALALGPKKCDLDVKNMKS